MTAQFDDDDDDEAIDPVNPSDADVIVVAMPETDGAAKVELMEDDEELAQYLPDDGDIDVDVHAEIVQDYIVEPELTRKQLMQLPKADVAALSDQIVQDASRMKAVHPDTDDWSDGGWS